MSALDQTMQGFQTGLGVAETLRNNRQKKIAAKNQAKYNSQMQNALGGSMPTMTPPIVPPNSAQSAPNPLSAPTQAPTSPQMPPQQQNALGGPNYAAAAQLAAQHGNTKAALDYQKMAGVRQTNQAAQSKTQADAQKAGLETMYRMGQQVMQDPSLLEPAKAQLIKMGMDQQTVAGITMQTLPQTMKLLEAQLGGKTQTLKDKETVYNPLTGKVEYSNRGPQSIADGAALVGADGAELYNNAKDVNPTADMQNFAQAQRGGYKGSFSDYQMALKKAGKSTVSVHTGGKLSAGREAIDKKYAADYLAWKQGGGSDNAKLINQLDGALEALDSGRNLTGPVLGLQPNAMKAFTNPEAVEVQDRIAEVVQRNLRVILGAQFTEKEGKMLMDRAFNPALGEEENARRVRALITQIKTAADSKEDAARYFEENETLRGWTGKSYSLADFERAVDGGGDVQAASSGFQSTGTGTADDPIVWQ